jgi:hypothetical protein
MRIKVEPHRDVQYQLAFRFTDEERDAFYRALERVRADPVGQAEAISVPKLSRYRLSFFRFGTDDWKKIAIFRHELARDCIRVLECWNADPESR